MPDQAYDRCVEFTGTCITLKMLIRAETGTLGAIVASEVPALSHQLLLRVGADRIPLKEKSHRYAVFGDENPA